MLRVLLVLSWPSARVAFVEDPSWRHHRLHHHQRPPVGLRRLFSSVGDDDDEAHELAAATLALLRGEEGPVMKGDRREVVRRVFRDEGGFEALAGALVDEVAKAETTAARATAQRTLEDPERLAEVTRRVAAKLFAAAKGASPRDVQVLLDAIRSSRRRHEIFPEQLRSLDEILGELQLLPPKDEDQGSRKSTDDDEWHAKVPGDGHVLRRWSNGKKFSVVGVGKSADASAYYVPELGVVFDAGLAVKTLVPKAVLLSHGHRDHVQALPALARRANFDDPKKRGPDEEDTSNRKKKNPVFVACPAKIEPLLRNFLQAEAALNFGQPQTPDETDAALGPLELVPVEGGDDFLLPRHAHVGPPLGVEVFEATHKARVPAVSFGLYHAKRRLKPEFVGKDEAFLRSFHKENITDLVKDYLLFYSGDTTTDLLVKNPSILRNYKYVIHECTFLGTDRAALDDQCAKTGHTHYLALHPFVVAHPDATFILAHFSTRYARSDVLDFFYDAYGGVPHNVVLWV